MNKSELEKAIAEKQAEIKAKQKELDNFEIDPYEYKEEYNDALDKQGDIHIGSLSYSPSHVLREVDPIAYRYGLNDFVDSLEVSDDPKYKELEEKLESLEGELSDLENELEELEEEEERTKAMKKYKLKVYNYNAEFLENDKDIELTTIKQLKDYLKSNGYKLRYIDFEHNVLMVTKYNKFSQR